MPGCPPNQHPRRWDAAGVEAGVGFLPPLPFIHGMNLRHAVVGSPPLPPQLIAFSHFKRVFSGFKELLKKFLSLVKSRKGCSREDLPRN